MQQIWLWMSLGLIPFEVAWQQARGKRTLALHSVSWSLVLCWRKTKGGQIEILSWTMRVLLMQVRK